MDSFDGFQLALVQIATQIIEPLIKDRREELEEVYDNFLFDIPGPVRLKQNLKRDQVFFARIYYGFTEIANSYEVLEDISTYVRRFPYRGTRVDRVRYLKFNIEAYLNEIYILQERTLAYLDYIKRAYRKTNRNREIEAVIQQLVSIVKETLGNITSIRGAHVHESRFSDLKIDRLATLELLTTHGHMEDVTGRHLKAMYQMAYRETRQEWARTIRDNNLAIRGLFNHYFAVLKSILFDENSELRYPVPCRHNTAP